MHYLSDGNQLFPVFLRVDRLHILIVGAGEVGWEKVGIMFKHTQSAQLKIVAPEIKPEIKTLKADFPDQITLEQRKFQHNDVEGVDIVIAATADNELNREVWRVAKGKGKLVNVADTPDLCDFYLSSVVKKGDLKVAISSNGKSPTLSKRMRELLEDVLPEEIDDLLQNLNTIREELKGDFDDKVKKLQEITEVFKNEK